MASAQILNSGKAMYAWNGTNWVPLNSLNTIVNSTRWQKVAVGNETTLSGLDDNNNTLSYSPGYEQIFLNGILLVRGTDYAATNGLSITGLEPISAGANIEIIALKQINLANVYNKDQVDSMIDNIQISASTTYEPNISYSSSTPAAPVAGTLWVDDTDPLAPVLKVYNGSEWITMSGAGGGGLKTHFLLMGA
jgi:hypothetical protein